MDTLTPEQIAGWIAEASKIEAGQVFVGIGTRGIARALLQLHDRVETLERLDREAATHVESVICMRTGFTGDPPYVGWKGLGLALTEALDYRDKLKAEFTTLRERVAVLEKERDALKRTIANCGWYWPDDDTSSEMCVDSPSDLYREGHPAEIYAISRGGVVETRYYAWLHAADDADSDDDFVVDEPTEELAKEKLAAEIARREALQQTESK